MAPKLVNNRAVPGGTRPLERVDEVVEPSTDADNDALVLNLSEPIISPELSSLPSPSVARAKAAASIVGRWDMSDDTGEPAAGATEREPLLGTGTRHHKKPFYRARPLWCVYGDWIAYAS